MKKTQLNITNIVMGKVNELTKKGLIPPEYTKSFFPDYKMIVQDDGKVVVNLTHSSRPTILNPLGLKLGEKALDDNQISRETIRDAAFFRNEDKIVLRVRVFNDRTRCLVKVPKNPKEIPLAELKTLLNDQHSVIVHEDKLYFLDKRSLIIEDARAEYSEAYEELISSMSQMEDNVLRIANQMELGWITRLETNLREDSTFGVDIVSIPIEGVEEELQNPDTVAQLLLAAPGKKEYPAFLTGEYKSVILFTEEDNMALIKMSKSTEVLIDLKTEDHIKELMFNIGDLSYDACQQQGISCQMVVEENPYKLINPEHDKAIYLQVGLTEQQNDVLERIKRVYRGMVRREELMKDYDSQKSYGYIGYRPCNVGLYSGSWPNGYTTEAAIHDEQVGNLCSLIEKNFEENYVQLRGLMSTRLNVYCDKLIEDGALPRKCQVSSELPSLSKTGLTFYSQSPKKPDDVFGTYDLSFK